MSTLTIEQPKSGTKKHFEITYHPPSSLTIDPGNPNISNRGQRRMLKASIKKFKFYKPIIADENKKVICGEACLLAAQELGLEEVPVIIIEGLTAAQIKALRIADNRLSKLSTFDDLKLAQQLQEIILEDPNFDIEVTGFPLDEVEFRIEGLNVVQDVAPDPDDQVSAPADGLTVSESADLWILGDHRVLHGDATLKPDIERLMDGKRAAICHTDPPYGVNYANSAKDKLRGTDRPILNDNLGEAFGDFLYEACCNILSVTDGSTYICMSSSALHILQSAFIRAGGHWATFIIWAKQTFTLGRADYQRQYEPILYGWREGAEHYWCGARDQGDVWFFDKPVKNDLHPCMKPIELIMRALRNSSQRGDIVLDPFLGSGSCLIAAERTGRACYGTELDLRYVDTICLRWQRHTGGDAIHAATGKKFNDIAAEKGISHDK